MVKTRRQTLNCSVKKEETKEESKLVQTLHGVKSEDTKINSNKITKKKRPKPKLRPDRIPVTEPEVKLEDTSDGKPLRLPLNRPLIEKVKDRWITQEKLVKLIEYIDKDKMSLNAASKKAKMGSCSALKYYNLYKNDPEHKIPVVGHDPRKPLGRVTNQTIETMIRSIVDDKMTINEVAKKTNTHTRTVSRYYAKYLADPNRNFPVRKAYSDPAKKNYTQEQVEKLIHYIYNGNTTLTEAARRVDMSRAVATRFYKMYKDDPENKIPNPEQRATTYSGTYTSEQIEKLINYIVHDKLSLEEASIKVNISINSAKKYYYKYLRDPNHEIPVPGRASLPLGKRCTQDQIKALIDYIVKDEMSVTAASKKAQMNPETGAIYYREFLQDPNRNIPQPRKYSRRPTKCVTHDEIKNLIDCIVNDGMTLLGAAKKVNIERHTAGRYYREYLKDPNRNIPNPTVNPTRLPTRDQVKQLFDYILNEKLTVIEAAQKVGISRQTAYTYHGIYKRGPENTTARGKNPNSCKQIKEMIDYVDKDNMRIKDAAKKAKMSKESAVKYYNLYKNDPEHKIPIPIPIGHSAKNRMFEENLQVITEIYKKNHIKIKTEE